MILFLLALAAGSAAPPQPGEKAAACLFAKADLGARNLLRTEPGSPEERAALAPLMALASKCGASAAPAVDEAGAAFRSSLARAVMRKRLTDFHAGPNSNPDYSPNMFVVEKGFDEAGAMQRPYRLASCVISVNLNGAAELARSAVNSRAEKEALAALVPSLVSCVDRGQQTSIRPEVMRNAIDIVLTYRLAPLFDPLPLNR